MSNPKRILVTGGSRGIGKAIAERFAAEGYEVAILASREETLQQALREAKQAGFAWKGTAVDLENPPTVQAAIKRVITQLGGTLDVLVNNAGVFDMAPLEETTLAMWQRFLTINLTGPFLVTQACLPALREAGEAHVLNISSVAGQQGFPHNTAYCTTKYGLRGFSDALRAELSEEGIQVSTIYPGATDTDIFNEVEGTWDRDSMNKAEDVASVAWDAVQCQPPRPDWVVPPRA